MLNLEAKIPEAVIDRIKTKGYLLMTKHLIYTELQPSRPRVESSVNVPCRLLAVSSETPGLYATRLHIRLAVRGLQLISDLCINQDTTSGFAAFHANKIH